jgi:ATP-dependent DNA helicase RecG
MVMIEVAKMLSMPEGKTLEFKRDLSSMQPILKTLVAFANTAGGTLIIGKDADGKVIGVDNIFESEEKLANAIADSIYPALMPDIEIMSIKRKSLLIVSVAHWWGPFYLKTKGPIEGVFVRLGSTNRVAGQIVLEELNRSKSKISFDQMPCLGTDMRDLDMEKISQMFEQVDKKIDENKLISLGILVPYSNKLVCSHGGLILFGHKEIREKCFPNSTVKCARFLGVEKEEFLDRYEVEGTILDAMKEIPNFIRRNTRLSSKIESIQREDISEYPLIAIREILTNALVHADYSVRGMNPRVMIFSDRIEIENPGLLPFGYTLEDFVAGISHIRNKVIARTFRELNMMEEWGTGYKRIEQVCHEGNYPIPYWEEVGTTVKVTLFPYQSLSEEALEDIKQNQEDLTQRQKEILQLFRDNHRLTPKEIASLLGKNISERTLRADLLQLKAKGLLVMIGKGPKTYWIIED